MCEFTVKISRMDDFNEARNNHEEVFDWIIGEKRGSKFDDDESTHEVAGKLEI